MSGCDSHPWLVPVHSRTSQATGQEAGIACLRNVLGDGLAIHGFLARGWEPIHMIFRALELSVTSFSVLTFSTGWGNQAT